MNKSASEKANTLNLVKINGFTIQLQILLLYRQRTR